MTIKLDRVVQDISIRSNTSGVTKIENELQGLEQTTARFGRNLTRSVSIPIAAGTALAVKSFVDVDRGLREVNSLFGQTGQIAEASFGELKNSVAELSNEVGIAQSELTDGLYQAISAGVPRDNAFEFLKIASEAAIAGVTDTTTAIDGITTIINAFGLEVGEAQDVADSLFVAVRGGKTTFDELSRSMAVVAPAAAAAGVEFSEVNAALATITASGTTTKVAATQLRAALVALQRPTAEMQQIFTDAGFASAQAAIESEGLGVALGLVSDAAAGDNGRLTELLGTVEAVGAAQILAGTGAEKFASELEAQEGRAGAATAAFEELEKSVGRRLQRLFVELQNTFIELGDSLIPTVEVLVGFGTTAVGVFGDVLDALGPLGPAFLLTAAAIGPALAVTSRLIGTYRSLAATLAAAKIASQIGAINTAAAASAGPVSAFAASGARSVTTLSRFGPLLGTLGPALGAVGIAAAVATPLIIKLAQGKTTLADEAKRVEAALVSETGALDRNVESVRQLVLETSRFQARNQIDDLNRLGLTVRQLDEQLGNGVDGFLAFANEAERVGEISPRLEQRLIGLARGGEAWIESAIGSDGVTEELAVRLRDTLTPEGEATAETLFRLVDAGGSLGSSNADLLRSFGALAVGYEEQAAAGNETLVVSGQVSRAQSDQATSALSAVDANAALTESQAQNKIAADALGVSVEEYVDRLNQAAIEQLRASEGGEAFFAVIDGLGTLLGGVSDDTLELGESIGETADEAAILESGLTALQESIIAEAEAAGLAASEISTMRDAFLEGNAAVEETAGAFGEAEAATEDLIEDIEGLSEALFELVGEALDASEAQDDLEQAIDDAAETAKDFKGAIDDDTEAARDMRGEIRDAIQAVIDLADSQETAEGKAQALASGFDRLKSEFPEFASFIDQFIVGSLDEIPQEVLVEILATDPEFRSVLEAAGVDLATIDAAEAEAKILADATEAIGEIVAAVNEGNTFAESTFEADVNVDASPIPGQIAGAEGAARSGGVSLGANISAGAQAGIEARAASVAAAAARMVRGALNEAKRVAGVRSPSRLFAAELGAPIADGVAVGVNSRQREVVGAVRDLVESANSSSTRFRSNALGVDLGEGLTEAVAEGILKRQGEASDAVEQVIQQAVDEANARLDSVFSAIGAGQGVGNAQRALSDAQAELQRLQTRERADRLRATEDAARDVEDARRQLEEARTFGVSDAQRDISDANRDRQDAQRDLADARTRLAEVEALFNSPTRGIEGDDLEAQDRARRQAQLAVVDAEDALREANRRRADIPGEIARAEADLNSALADSARVTDSEAVEIQRRQAALFRVSEEYRNGEASIEEVRVAEDSLAQSRIAAVDADRQVVDIEERLADLREEQRDISRTVIEAEFDLADARDRLNDTTSANALISERAQEVSRELEQAKRDVADAERNLEDATRSVTDANRGLEDAQREVLEAERDLKDSQRELAEAQHAQIRLLSEIEDAERAVEDAQLDVVQAQRELIDAGQELIRQGPQGIDTFRRLATAAGLTRDQIDNLIDSYGALSVAAGRADSGVPEPTDPGQTGTGSGGTYNVQRGDSLSSIASQLNYPGGWPALYGRNRDLIGSNPSRIFPGQTLQLQRGGFIPADPGRGVFAQIGEGRHDEVVFPIGDSRATAAMASALRMALDEIGGGNGGTDIDITVINPEPEPASTTLGREMRKLSGRGILDESIA